MNEFIGNPESKYNDGIMVNEYNGKYSLLSASEAEDGTIYMRWAFPKGKDKGPGSKAIPLGVNLGSAKNAAAMLRAALAAIEGEAVDHAIGDVEAGDDESPF